LEGEAEGGAADTEFGAIQEDRGADALVVKEGAVGGIEVLEVNHVAANFQDTVVTRNLGIVEGEVRAFAADDHAGLLQGEGVALRGAIEGGEDQVEFFGEHQAVVNGGELEACSGGVGARERGHGRDDHGFVDAFFDLDDGGFATFGATELNFGMLRQDRVVQQMLLATMNTAGLHEITVARWGGSVGKRGGEG
jgi:hypothetical protein